MHYLPGARRVAGLVLIGLLAGCSSGGGGDEAAETQISTNAITFTASSPSAATPAAQVVTATFGEDIAHVAVVHSGAAIVSATSVLNGRTAQITITPQAPGTLGPGPFTGAVAVTGYTCADATCTRLSAGSTATVAINYQISPVIQTVAPYVATAGVADTVIIRGFGFQNFNIAGARFGDIAATEFRVISGTEIAVRHPALPAGTYTVHVDASNHEGDIPSAVELVVQDPIVFPAATLSHVAGTTAVRSLVYDAERRALLTVTETLPSYPIVRYAYENGAWTPPLPNPVGMVDVALSVDGSQLFALTPTALVRVDPVTLGLGTPVAAPSLETNSILKNIVVGNDNRALVTTSLVNSGSTRGYIFDPTSNALLIIGSPTLNNGTPAMTANGAGAVVIQGDPSLTTDTAVYSYSTAANSLTVAAPTLRQNAVAPAIDRAGTRVVLNGRRVYDGVLAFLGTLPDSTAAVVLKPDGKRAYAYDPTVGGILVYDISVDRDEAAYTALGAPVPLAGDPGSGVRMAITPDGGTLFLAGSAQIVVQPTPAL